MRLRFAAGTITSFKGRYKARHDSRSRSTEQATGEDCHIYRTNPSQNGWINALWLSSPVNMAAWLDLVRLGAGRHRADESDHGAGSCLGRPRHLCKSLLYLYIIPAVSSKECPTPHKMRAYAKTRFLLRMLWNGPRFRVVAATLFVSGLKPCLVPSFSLRPRLDRTRIVAFMLICRVVERTVTPYTIILDSSAQGATSCARMTAFLDLGTK